MATCSGRELALENFLGVVIVIVLEVTIMTPELVMVVVLEPAAVVVLEEVAVIFASAVVCVEVKLAHFSSVRMQYDW